MTHLKQNIKLKKKIIKFWQKKYYGVNFGGQNGQKWFLSILTKKHPPKIFLNQKSDIFLIGSIFGLI